MNAGASCRKRCWPEKLIQNRRSFPARVKEGKAMKLREFYVKRAIGFVIVMLLVLIILLLNKYMLHLF